ncbi:MAG TPA: hypothetical protein VFI65_21625 [Streptosporangiaceae bacterium]|nr:hypothetical protein [Streptosporangiaceae bacterium]
MASFAAAACVVTVASSATLAVAAPLRSAGIGQFSTWRSAQSAAGFHLMRPAKTYGLPINSKISVARCEISKKTAKKRLVIASYGRTVRANLTISQNNSGAPCTKTRQITVLGHYLVQGKRATLIGICGVKGLPSCKSTKIFLFLSWRANGIYYQAMSYGFSRKVVVGFAKGLVRV